MVKCVICGREFKAITNTHLQKDHTMYVEEYLVKFPGVVIRSEETIARHSKSAIGKNKGNKRPDAQKRMLSGNNPMKDGIIAAKAGLVRKAKIASGELDVMSNFNHLPTRYEKVLIQWFSWWNIPLRYVGAGEVLIGSYCPDFINEELKIVLELELNFCKRPRNEISDKEQTYKDAGYKIIWVTRMDRDYVRSWVTPFFEGGLRSTKIKKIWSEGATGRQSVYNMEVTPNNTYVAGGIVVHNCYANAFRASLYTAFFDNSKTMGFRHCNADYYKKELDKLLTLRGKDPHSVKGDVAKAIAMDVPMRFGIRFEDFLKEEEKAGISLTLLEYLADNEYPLMINTKSDLVAAPAYLKALSSNKAGTAVHITMISNDEGLLARLEPGAPTFAKRLAAAKALCDAGVRVVARIEPFLVFVNDNEAQVREYMDQIWDAGIRNITFDTYSYTANNPGIKSAFIQAGIDYDRIFMLGCDSQALGSLLLGKFMDEFRKYGFSSSTFDMGNAPDNDQAICCEVGDWFKGGFNYGCTVMAARFIMDRKGQTTSWSQFVTYVDAHGGFLSETLKREVHELWNGGGNLAYSHFWSKGIIPAGADSDGLKWKFDKKDDHRISILEAILG